MRKLKTIPVARPAIGEDEVIAARRVILSGWVTQGPEVAAFEKEFARFAGADYACAVSSCTSALHLALKAVGVGPGDEVITVSHSFIATANSIRYCGAVPVFVDIEPATYNMNPVLVEKAITRKTRAILCVHQMGMPCDLKAILAIARRHKLKVVEDAACAIGSEIKWKGKWERIGKPHGDIACFSFHPRKIMTTGDGGMLTTRHKQYDRLFRLWRQHGMSISDAVRHKSGKVLTEKYVDLGYNYRMTDIQAAVGRVQLRRLPGLVARRRTQAKHYHELLSVMPALGLPHAAPWARSNWQSYCVRLSAGIVQKDVMQKMLDDGIATRRGIMCSHREPAYEDNFADCSLPESEKAQDTCILLPLYHSMTNNEQNRVAASLLKACGWKKGFQSAP